MSPIKGEFLTFGVLVVFCALAVYFFGGPSPAKAEQPMSAKLAYVTEDFRVWCESPSGDKIYVSKAGPGAGGTHVAVIPGGCK